MSFFKRKKPTKLYDFFLSSRHKPIHKWHHYFEIYEKHFGRFRNQRIKLLEIGVQKGGSLQMWKSYFMSGSSIYGIDIDPACKTHEEPGIDIFIGDVTDTGFLRQVVGRTGPLDIVIDDGGHTMTQQINAFAALYPNVRDHGVYLVEDTHTSFWPTYIDTSDKRTFLQLAHEKTLELYGWTGQSTNFEKFSFDRGERQGNIDVSEFCRTTASIHFYDSVVVFEKYQRSEPRHQVIGTIL